MVNNYEHLKEAECRKREAIAMKVHTSSNDGIMYWEKEKKRRRMLKRFEVAVRCALAMDLNAETSDRGSRTL